MWRLYPRVVTSSQRTPPSSLSEYGFLVDQGLPKFVQTPWQKAQNNIWNRLFYLELRNGTAAQDYDKAMIDGAWKWLEHPPKEPWLLFLSLQFPHPPFTVEEPFFSIYKWSDMPVPVSKEEKVSTNTSSTNISLSTLHWLFSRLATYLVLWPRYQRSKVPLASPYVTSTGSVLSRESTLGITIGIIRRQSSSEIQRPSGSQLLSIRGA